MKNDKKLLVDFLTNDFNDTSQKLESTDKKIQYIIQIFGLTVSALLTVLIAFFLPTNTGGNNSLQQFIFVIMIIFIVIVIGEFLFVYNLLGHKTHIIYISRMNMLRSMLYRELNETLYIDVNHAYAKKPGFKEKGMNYVMSLFLSIFNIILCGFLSYLISLASKNWRLAVLIGLSLVIIIIILNLTVYYIIIKKKATSDVKTMWEDYEFKTYSK